MTILVMYNTIMALAAGAGLIGVALLGRQLKQRHAIAAEGWSLLFGILGFILTILGFVMSITWPFRLPGTFDANILMGEPSIAFGLLLLAGSFYLWQRRLVFAAMGSRSATEAKEAAAQVNRTLKPVSIFVFAVGLMLAACAAAWIRYQLGGAPSIEPLSGYLATVVFKSAPAVESIFLGVLWGLVSLGSLLFPLTLRRNMSVVSTIVFLAWIIAGIAFLVFGALNFYTHIGLITNMTSGTHFKV